METAKRLEALSEQLRRWRKATPKRSRLPEEFWSEAVAIAREAGLYRTAKRLPVDWRQLKRRMERERSTAARKAAPAFVEVTLAGAPTKPPRACVLERETKQGRLRLELTGLSVAELAELVKALEA